MNLRVAQAYQFPVREALNNPCGTHVHLKPHKKGEGPALVFKVKCSGRRISSIVIRDEGNFEAGKSTLLGGHIPASVLASLPAVVRLDFAYNNFNGHFPKQMAKLKRLKHLNLGANMLEGKLPSGVLGRMRNLEWMSVDTNKLSGPLPARAFPKLTKMKNIFLGSNHFTGTLPSTIGKMASLTWFNVHNCSLTGALPREISELKKLNSFGVEHNMLSGKVPDLPFGQYTKYCSWYHNKALDCPAKAAAVDCCRG
jgi:hypothetical protein